VPPNITFQIILYETSNNIEIHSTNCASDGGPHTQGITNAAGTGGAFLPGRTANATLNLVNDGVRFSRTPNSGAFNWTANPTLNNNLLEDPIATPVLGATTYYLNLNQGGCTRTDSVRVFQQALQTGTVANACPGGTLTVPFTFNLPAVCGSTTFTGTWSVELSDAAGNFPGTLLSFSGLTVGAGTGSLQAVIPNIPIPFSTA
jgi:hypothetical protein